MDIDKKIISDIKAIFSALFKAGLNLWQHKLKIAKWLAIIIVLFLLYRVYKILTIHHVVIQNHVVSKIIHIKKTGYYRLAVYIKPKMVYFHKRRILAETKKTKNLQALQDLTVHHYLYAYKSKILLSKKNIAKFKKDRYRHLIYRAKITGKGSSPFVLFYVSFSNPDLPDRIIYTPVNIPVKNVLRNYTELGKFRNNGYIELTKNPNKKKPEVSLTKFLYLYPQFTIKGKVKYVKAYIKYKIKHKVYFSRQFNLPSKGLINLYGILKNKKIKHLRDANIIKIYFIVKKYKKIKGSVKFTNLDLIYPNYLPLKKVFERFVYKRYFIRFIQKSRLFNKILKKEIKRSKQSGMFVSEKKIKQALILKTLNEIFFADYNTKIKHIGSIKNKTVRHFYRFIYRKYLTERNFFSPLLSYFNKPRHFYKNILIPVPSKGVRIKTRKEFNGNTSYYNKTTYIYVHFNKLKLYRYWTTNKRILKKILKKYNLGANNSFKSFILRGNNDDYWHGRHYYKRYPILKGLRIFAFDKKINKISGYFYYKSLPVKYPEFLKFPANLYSSKTKKINLVNFLNLPTIFSYKNQLRLFNSFNLDSLKLLKTSFLLTKNKKIINVQTSSSSSSSSSSSRFGVTNKTKKLFFKLFKTDYRYYKKVFILKFKAINIGSYNYGLIEFKTNINFKYIKKLMLKGFLINYNKTKKIRVPLTYFLIKNKLSIIIPHLKSINIMNFNKLILIFDKKNITHYTRFNFKLINNKIYLIRYHLSNISLLNILLNQTLFKLNNKKFSLKDFNASSNVINTMFKKDGFWMYKRIYLKKGQYFIKNMRMKYFNFKFPLISLKKNN